MESIEGGLPVVLPPSSVVPSLHSSSARSKLPELKQSQQASSLTSVRIAAASPVLCCGTVGLFF